MLNDAKGGYYNKYLNAIKNKMSMSIPILLKIAGIEGRMMTALKFEHQDDTNAGDYDINVTVRTIKC